ncbi:HAD family hydrolase [Lachnospiraceae bacterium 62-35]
MIKLFVSDIDGTLVPEGGHEINPELLSVILKLKEKGIQFAAASGRHVSSIDRIFRPIRERIFYIADNGGFIGLYNRPLFLEAFPKDVARAFIRDMKQVSEVELVVSSPEVAYMEPHNEDFRDWIVNGYGYQVKIVNDMAEIDDTILKISCYCEKGPEGIYKKAVSRYGTYGNAAISGKGWMDFTPLNINKGWAVKVLQESLNIKPEETFVFGDQLNDLEMMERAYYSFAVGSAREEVRQRARFQADRSDRDGVLKVLKCFL